MDIQFRLRIRQGDLVVIGPGKIALLEAIGATGSISAAARALGMSYRRAWMLVDEMNRGLIGPVVDTAAGGIQGGGAVLTGLAQEIIERYRSVEAEAAQAAAGDLAWLQSKIIK
jgi:molybdate transport system regulatory protein